MLKEEMIERLIQDDIDTIIRNIQDGDYEYLEYVLRLGSGYENQTLREVIDEYSSRTWEDE